MLREGAYDIAVGALLSYVSAALLWSVVFRNPPILGDMERGLRDSDRGFGPVGENVLMKAIECRACGEIHWGLCAGAREFVSEKVANSMVNKPDPVLDSPAFIAKVNERYDALVERGKVPPRANKCADRGPDPDKQVPIPASATYKYRDAEKRRAYQREYMRKRRASANT